MTLSEAGRRDAKTRAEVDELLDRTHESRARSASVLGRRDEIMAESAALHERSWLVRAQSRAVRDWSAAVREERGRALEVHSAQEHVGWFSLTGRLGGRAVWARWERGHLECEVSLRSHAELLVDLGTVFKKADPPAWVEATLTGQAAAVMLTLARACDTVTQIDFEPAPPRRRRRAGVA